MRIFLLQTYLSNVDGRASRGSTCENIGRVSTHVQQFRQLLKNVVRDTVILMIVDLGGLRLKWLHLVWVAD